MKKYAFFSGCSTPSRCPQYELSVRKIAQHFNIGLVDLDGFQCCGYPTVHVDHDLYMSMSARNITIAEENGLDIVTLCSACAMSLTKANYHLKKDPELRARINKVLAHTGHEFKGTQKVMHFQRVLVEDVGYDAINKAVKNKLEGLRVAPHYGCHYLRPHEIYEGFDSPHRPETLDKLIEATGATSVDYLDKMKCCGGAVLAIEETDSMTLVKEKLDNIKAVGADMMVLHCPFCDIMYDEYQQTIEQKWNIKYNLPVLFYPQLLGLALGMDPKKDLGINKNAVKNGDLVPEIQAKVGGVH